MLKEWTDTKGNFPLDCFVKSLHELQKYYYYEIKRGFSGGGNYVLKSQFKNSKSLCGSVTSITSMDTIIKNVKLKLSAQAHINKRDKQGKNIQ